MFHTFLMNDVSFNSTIHIHQYSLYPHLFLFSAGQPVPRVIWYEDGRAVEGLLEYLPNKQIRNVLHIAELSRANHHVRYSCAASNSRILPPLVSAVTVLMRRKRIYFYFSPFKALQRIPFFKNPARICCTLSGM